MRDPTGALRHHDRVTYSIATALGVAGIMAGQPAAGSFATGAAVGAFGPVFAGVAAVTVQPSSTTRGAGGLAAAALGLAFLASGVGNMLGSADASALIDEIVDAYRVSTIKMGGMAVGIYAVQVRCYVVVAVTSPRQLAWVDRRLCRLPACARVRIAPEQIAQLSRCSRVGASRYAGRVAERARRSSPRYRRSAAVSCADSARWSGRFGRVPGAVVADRVPRG